MTEQLAIEAVASFIPAKNEGKPLTRNQQLAWDLIRASDGVTAAQVGQEIHARGQSRRHSLDVICQWCEKTGNQTASSKALKPLVTFKRTDGGRLYIARNKADRLRAAESVREPTEAELAANPFAGLEMPGTGCSNTAEGDA